MKEFELKYGCNPNQKPAKIYMADGSELPVKILSGRPGYINFLDAFNGWQLVSNLKKATGLPAATSFKHVSPAGAAVGLPLTETLAKIYWVNDMDWKNFSPLACAYARARGADRMSSFGDFISLSDVCDKDTALLIKREVSDGVIAPGYTEEALEILKQKKKGNYNVIQIDENFVPAPLEHKEVFGVTFEQGRQELEIDDAMLSNIVTENKELTEEAKRDMKISLIILKYTQSNSVCFVKDGRAIVVGAGQQSRVHCTRLAGQKADNWYLRQCPKVLNLPFKDTISRAERDNAIDVYIGDEYMDVLADGNWEKTFDGGGVWRYTIHTATQQKKRGVIVNTLSFAATIPSAGSGIYAASKAAMTSLTRTMAAEWAPKGIRVNGYSPGVIETEMTKPAIQNNGENMLDAIALHHFGKVDEMVKVVGFLASEDSEYITGINLDASGGKYIVQNAGNAWKEK